MTVLVCVGSSCHLKGSYNVMEMMKEAISKHHLEEKIDLKAAFCLGRCANGVTIKVDDEIVTGVSKDTFEEIFEKHILSRI